MAARAAPARMTKIAVGATGCFEVELVGGRRRVVGLVLIDRVELGHGLRIARHFCRRSGIRYRSHGHGITRDRCTNAVGGSSDPAGVQGRT
jgi:hypothetical protein